LSVLTNISVTLRIFVVVGRRVGGMSLADGKPELGARHVATGEPANLGVKARRGHTPPPARFAGRDFP
jgi:hypothetical protein